jgi:N-acetylglucosaminyldiphosphoundecaprenol N-acetyl-beta-D-mannosaminyltransferase
MLEKKDILGIPFVSATWPEVSARLEEVVRGNGKELWVTANPEVLERSFRDSELQDILRQGAVVFPDGAGILLAAELLKTELPQRLSGIDMIPLFKPYSLYLVGARSSVVKQAAEVLTGEGYKVAGYFHGYFDEAEEGHLLASIAQCHPQILLVGLGMGKQEKWLAKHLAELPINIGLTVGGSFDVLAGVKKRAPRIVQTLNLEWLYRLLQEPQRIGRQMSLLKFIIRVLRRKF